MKLTVKTLKGNKFEVEVDDSKLVSDVKTIIETEKPELPAAGMKLIHSGKVLKDTDSIAACGIKPNDFLVVMITKPKKAAPPAATAATAATTTAAATPASPATSTAAAAADATQTPAPSATTTTTTTTTTTDASTAAAPSAPAAPNRPDELPAEAIANLTAMGFPEAEVRHCLRAAHGNPDIAVEFLTNGIPEAVSAAMTVSSSGTTTTPARSSGSTGSTTGPPLQSLRNHPQFNDLHRLVQSNPQMLQQVLTQIGQQQPELLQEINANQALFIQMMNEPVDASSATSAAPSSSSRSPGLGGAGAGGLGNPAQMAQMIQNMTAEEVEQMAAMMGMSADHLRQTAQVIGQMPPEQINQFMMQALGGGGGGDDLAGMMGGMGGPQVLELTEEEMQAVDRLTEMGFDRAEAAQAFLACDKNEAQAANLLMDSMGDGGGFFGGGGGDGSGGNNDGSGGGDSGNGDANDDDEDMYD